MSRRHRRQIRERNDIWILAAQAHREQLAEYERDQAKLHEQEHQAEMQACYGRWEG